MSKYDAGYDYGWAIIMENFIFLIFKYIKLISQWGFSNISARYWKPLSAWHTSHIKARRRTLTLGVLSEQALSDEDSRVHVLKEKK